MSDKQWDDLVDPARAALEALITSGDNMTDRIEELEAKGLANRVAIMKLEAKLAKAVEALHWIGTRSIMLDAGADSLRLHARMILAELKGEK